MDRGFVRHDTGRSRSSTASRATLAALMLFVVTLAGAPVALASDELEEEPDPLFDDFFDEEFDEPAGYPDPLEETNRGTFAFNRQLDRWILDPVTEGYRAIVPEGGRKAIARFFANLGSTKTLVNDLLQLEWEDARSRPGAW